MESLVQYGSESSDDDEDRPIDSSGIISKWSVSSQNVEVEATAATANGVLSNVAVAAVVKDEATSLLQCKVCGEETTDEQQTSTSRRKRRRRWDVPQQQDPPPKSNHGPLPSPPLGSNTSLILWDQDYLCYKPSSYNEPNLPSMSHSQQEHLREKLNQLNTTFSTSSNSINAAEVTTPTIDTSSSPWAFHLKRQQEFHNPHFLNSVISHFGLNVLGSNIPPKEAVEEFEYNLVAMEEEARHRQQQQLQFQPPMNNSKLYYDHASAASSSSSLLIQSDLEQAMRGQY
jgi:hypothetical protein